MEKKVINILFCGTGGQGILKAAEVCGWAAMICGYHAKKSEVHGMAQRGGSVESHLRFGDVVFSPLIPKGEADFLVPFEEGEHDRLHPFLKENGIDLLDEMKKAMTIVTDKRYFNTYLLGVLSKHLPINEESWMSAFEKVFHHHFHAENKKVFLAGRSA